jgi:type IV secretion system protein VirB11
MSYLDTYLGQLDSALSDPAVMEVAINADGRIWLERGGALHMAPAGLPALPARSVRDLAAQIANSTSNTFTEGSPLVSAAVRYRDLMLRCQVVGPPAAAGGTIIGIRIFRSGQPGSVRPARSFSFLRDQVRSLEEERRDMVAEIRTESKAADVDGFLRRLVDERLNIIVSGGTSTGKTELGRKLLGLVPEDERIVTIEDSLELFPGQPNTVSLIAQRDEASPRSADKLLQATLRLRPDRVILGELRGPEAATFLDAINTGHSGSFTTLHAHSARKAMDRLALLVMAQGTRLGFAEVIRYLETSIDVILQMGREGERRGIRGVFSPALDPGRAPATARLPLPFPAQSQRFIHGTQHRSGNGTPRRREPGRSREHAVHSPGLPDWSRADLHQSARGRCCFLRGQPGGASLGGAWAGRMGAHHGDNRDSWRA